MCFLYRQSISIVYESKFKYIYRYFIKIDRCFCGILQSLPLRKCGLKYNHSEILIMLLSHFPCGSVDWNMGRTAAFSVRTQSLPLRKCGLKYEIYRCCYPTSGHFPCGSVDWNYQAMQEYYGLDTSLPLRKCGLKYTIPGLISDQDLSLPLRKCGLKS